MYSTTPLLSVIIPLYNQAHLVGRCVKSVEDQGFSDSELEVLIINDGSSDNAVEVVNVLQQKYGNIRLINQENRGLSGARNRGIDEARGLYLYFIDSDDALRPNYLSLFVKQLKESKANLFVFNYEKVPDISKAKTIPMVYQSPKRVTPNDLPYSIQYVCWVHIYDTVFLRQSGVRFDENIRLHEDTIFMISLLYSQDVDILFADIPVLLYIYNPNSIINNANKDVVRKRRLEQFKVLKILQSLREKLNLDEGLSNFMREGMVFGSRDCVDAMFTCQIDLTLRQKINNIKWLKDNNLYPSYRKVSGFRLKLFEFCKNHIATFVVFILLVSFFKKLRLR